MISQRLTFDARRRIDRSAKTCTRSTTPIVEVSATQLHEDLAEAEECMGADVVDPVLDEIVDTVETQLVTADPEDRPLVSDADHSNRNCNSVESKYAHVTKKTAE